MSLLAKSRKEGQIQHITPQSAGWRYIGFDVWMLKKGQTVTLESGDRELCLVLVAGLASVKTQHADFPNLGKRMSPFERTPPWSVYVPPQDKVEVTADSDLELAVCSAPGKGRFPARLIRPPARRADARGGGMDRGRNAPPRPRSLSRRAPAPGRARTGRQRRLISLHATLPCASTPHNATRRCPPLTAPAHGVARAWRLAACDEAPGAVGPGFF